MRVCLLGPHPADVGSPGGGVESAIVTLARGLVAVGHSVLVVDAFSGAGRGVEEGLGYEVVRTDAVGPWETVRAFPPKSVVDVVDAWDADVVHLHLAPAWAESLRPSVLTVHGVPAQESRVRHRGLRGRLAGAVLMQGLRRGLGAADSIVAISDEVASLAAAQGRSVHRIPNAVEADFFAVGREVGHDLLMVGEVSPLKNQAFAAAAFACYAARGGRGDLVIVGPVAHEAYAQSCVEAAGLHGDRVHVVGPVPHADVLERLRAAGLYVSTSLRETSSLGLLEALATGARVVTLDVGTAQQHVTSPSVGILLPVDATPDEVAEAMLEAVDTPPAPESSRAAAQEHRPERIVQATLEVYEHARSRRMLSQSSKPATARLWRTIASGGRRVR